MEKKKETKLIIILIIIIICLSVGGSFVLYKVLSSGKTTNIGETNNNNQQLDSNLNNPITHNYNTDQIKNVEVEVPVKNASDPEMKKVTITNKNEIADILSNVTNLELVGKMPAVGFLTNVTITVNYKGDPSAKIIILDNGNVAINFGVGAGESGYAEYKITNKNLSNELTNKYQ